MISKLVQEHAVDESRHARFYISLLEMAFPDAVEETSVKNLISLSPGYSANEIPPVTSAKSTYQVFDDLIQMNIGEIRTLIHQLLMRPVLILHCAEENRVRLQRLLDSLRNDEARHILYTANLIERFCVKEPKFVRSVMIDRVKEFNGITMREVGAFDFH